MENVEVQHESVDMSCTRKRRFSATVKDAFLTKDANATDDDSNNEADVFPASKQRQLDNEQREPLKNGSTYAGFTLEDFCDELLFEIFKHLDTWTILALKNCSPRFDGLLLDRRFWENIDLSKGPLPLGILEDVLVRSNDKTHTIKICGPPSEHHGAGLFKQFTTTLTSIFPKLQSQLQVLEMQGVSLDFSYIHITDFPASLKRLVLKDCSVKIPDDIKSIFHTMDTHLKELEELGIEDCDWFEPYYIMAISKLPILRKLSLKGCRMLSKFVPYGSMAARFGFHKLEVLDFRLTPINNADLQCFGAVETLKELLLDCPERKPEEPEPETHKETPVEPYPDSIGLPYKIQRLRRRSLENNACFGSCLVENPTEQPPIPGQAKNYGRPLQPRPPAQPSHGPDVFDDDTPSTSARATLSRILFNRAAQRAREEAARRFKMDSAKAEGSVDKDDIPSSSNGACALPKEENQNEASNTEAENKETSSSLLPGEELESDTEECCGQKITANGAEEEERYSSSSPPLSLSDSVKVNASNFSDDSDDDDDDDDDNDNDDNDDTETRSTISVSDQARESSPTTSPTSSSSTNSDASSPSVVVIRINDGMAPGPSTSAAAGIPFSGAVGVAASGSAGMAVSGAASVAASGAAGVVASGAAGVVASGAAGVVASGAAGVAASGAAGVAASGAAGVAASGAAGVVAAGSAAGAGAADSPDLPPTQAHPPHAYVVCSRQQGTFDDVLQRMEQIRSNVRLLHQRRAGNNPAYSRYLPRPCQIICMNPQNPREPLYVMHSRRVNFGHQHQHRGANQFDQVMGHPMFWNMLDPLNMQGARRHRHRTTLPNVSTQVTDRAMYSFGRATNPVEPGVIWIRNINRAQNNQLERIELRNYTQITNLTLQHLMQCSPNLVYIDVSGTSVTRAGVRAFQDLMPNCTVVATHIKEDDDGENMQQSGQPENEDENADAPTAEEQADDEQEPAAANEMQLLAPIEISPEAINAIDEAVARLVLPMRMPVPINGEPANGEVMERVNGDIEDQLDGEMMNQINGEVVEQLDDELVNQLNDQLLEAAGVELPAAADNEPTVPIATSPRPTSPPIAFIDLSTDSERSQLPPQYLPPSIPSLESVVLPSSSVPTVVLPSLSLASNDLPHDQENADVSDSRSEESSQ